MKPPKLSLLISFVLLLFSTASFAAISTTNPQGGNAFNIGATIPLIRALHQ